MRLMMLAAMAAWLLSGVATYAQDCSATPPKVCLFKNAFNPNPTGGDAAGSPVCDGANFPSEDDKNKVLAAYNLAPKKIQAELCKAEIYIFTSNTQTSWGRWESPVNHANFGKTQIAINSTDLGTTFSSRQEKHFKGLGIDNHGNHPSEFIPGRLDPETLGLLYVLAHELGHIRWHKDVAVSDVGCTGDITFYSWKDAKSQRWTGFKQENLGDHKNTNIKKPKDVQNPGHLKAIYTGGFVTALAATNPEEDFVESYAIRVLMDACPTCELYVEIPKNSGGKIRINDDGGQPVLKTKFDCIYNKYIK